MADGKTIIARIKRILRNALEAWWVLLIIVLYMIFARWLTGTSCIQASTIGIPCPGCGITRAFILLMQGDLSGSLHYHPLLIPAAIIMILYAALSLVYLKKPRYPDKSLGMLAIALAAVYVVRMILLFPGEEPMRFNGQAIVPRIVGYIMKMITDILSFF